MSNILRMNNRKVEIQGDGKIFVEGVSTDLKQWPNDSTRFSNFCGSEQLDLKGMGLSDALMVRGFLPRR